MDIKDPGVHAMARELAARRGTGVTDAVRQALRAELDRCANLESRQEEAAKRKRCASGSKAAAICPGRMGAAAATSRATAMTTPARPSEPAR